MYMFSSVLHVISVAGCSTVFLFPSGDSDSSKGKRRWFSLHVLCIQQASRNHHESTATIKECFQRPQLYHSITAIFLGVG